MRRTMAPWAVLLLLGPSACGEGSEMLSPSFGASSQGCALTLTSVGGGSVGVAANSIDNRASWTIQNKGKSAVRLKGQVVSKSGAVTAVRPLAWVTFPYSLAGGAQVAAALSFDVGASGSGTVGMSVTANCGTVGLPQQSITVAAPPPPPPSGEATGIPFGPSGLFTASGALRQAAPFTLTLSGSLDTTIIPQINAARAGHVRLVPAMTGGSHARYVTDAKFDLAKWKAKMNTFNTDAIKAAVAEAVADSTIPFTNLMDEPNDPDWGGVMTHALLDEMSRYVKGIFPTIRTGVAVQWDWQSTTGYESLDVLVTQYAVRKGDVRAYRDSAVASAQRQGLGLLLAMNVLNGGKQLGPACPSDQTGGTGTSVDDINCSMTPEEIQTFGDVLVSEPYSCGLSMFAWDASYMGLAETRVAFEHVASTAAQRTFKECR